MSQHREEVAGLAAQLEETRANLESEVKRNAELNEVNSKLIGHGNAKAKIQHTVKLKEECNELSSQLKLAQASLVKAKDKGDRLEKEVNKLRAALGLEGGAAQVLAEEACVREVVEQKEKECAELKERLVAAEKVVMDILGEACAGEQGSSKSLLDRLKGMGT